MANMNPKDILAKFLETLPEDKQDEFVEEFQALPPEEQQAFLQALAQKMQGQPMMQKGGTAPNQGGHYRAITNNEYKTSDDPYKGTKGTRGTHNSKRNILQEGSKGKEVEDLQVFLKNKGFYKGEVDQKYGPKTKQAVIEYQKWFNENSQTPVTALTKDGHEMLGAGNKKIKVDGIVGDQTRAALMYRDSNYDPGATKSKRVKDDPNTPDWNEEVADGRKPPVMEVPVEIWDNPQDPMGWLTPFLVAGAAAAGVAGTSALAGASETGAAANLTRFGQQAANAVRQMPRSIPQGTTSPANNLPRAFGPRPSPSGNVRTAYQQGGMPNTVPVEVEGDETMLTPDKELYKFEGPKHSEGGIDANLPGGAYIYSEHLKVPDEIYQTLFNKPNNGKKKSFADLSKKFTTKGYKKVLEDPDADPIKKQTAEYELSRNLANLETLFMAQEGVKQEQEQAKMMKYGGIPMKNGRRFMQNAGRPGDNIVESPALISTEELIGKYNSGLSYGIDDQSLKQEIDRRYKSARTNDVFGRQAFGSTVDPRYDEVSKAPLNLFDMTVNRPGQTVKGDQSISPGTPLIDSFGQPDLLPTGKFQVLDIGIPKGGVDKKAPIIPPTPGKGKPKDKTPAPVKPNFPVPQPRGGDGPAPALDDIGANAPYDPLKVVEFQPREEEVEEPYTPEKAAEVAKKKRYWGIDDKLAGTLFDMAVTASEHVKIDGPQYRDNRKYPIFSRFIDQEDTSVRKMYDKNMQQIMNSNQPQQVKQAQIANLEAQYQDYQGQIDTQNTQRYSAKIDQDLNKLQSYMDSNVDQATKDIDTYRQRKAHVDYLRDQFKANRRSRLLNSGRQYFDYASQVNKMNQLYSDNYDYNPITGRVNYTGNEKDDLKQTEDLMATYRENAKNAIQISPGVNMVMLSDTVGIVVGPDNNPKIVELENKKSQQSKQANGTNPWGL